MLSWLITNKLKQHIWKKQFWNVQSQECTSWPCGTLAVITAIYFLNSSSIIKLCACRLTDDCEQRVRAMESLDVCSSKFSFSRSEEVVRNQSSRMLCDVLLDQAVMPGVGNIIKNEALFDSGLHPAVKVWKRWWIVFSRGTKKRVKMQDNSHRKS